MYLVVSEKLLYQPFKVEVIDFMTWTCENFSGRAALIRTHVPFQSENFYASRGRGAAILKPKNFYTAPARQWYSLVQSRPSIKSAMVQQHCTASTLRRSLAQAGRGCPNGWANGSSRNMKANLCPRACRYDQAKLCQAGHKKGPTVD